MPFTGVAPKGNRSCGVGQRRVPGGTQRLEKCDKARLLVPPPASNNGSSDEEVEVNELFNDQFMGVLQQSIARQGADSLMQGASIPDETRPGAIEEVLEAALNQSKFSLNLMQQWKNQIEAQIVAQQKQVSRLEFSLNKSRTDTAYLNSLKKMLYDSEE